MYVTDDHVIIIGSIYKSSLNMEETFPDKGILKKLTIETKSLAFYTAINKVETLKHLITYKILRTYINSRNVH